MRSGGRSLEYMTVAADPDPYYALPSLFGAPAYARAPKAVPDSERPFDPDDLPIVAEQTDEERSLAEMLMASGSFRAGGALGPVGPLYGTASYGASAAHGDGNGNASSRGNGSGSGVGSRRFSLRALTDRVGPHPR